MKFNSTTHHRRSIRLNGYDYSQEGLYFITICCYNKESIFGTIENQIMVLHDLGNIVKQCWYEIPNHFENVILHDFVIMPNHIHGIVQLVGAKYLSPYPSGNISSDFIPPENIFSNELIDVSNENCSNQNVDIQLSENNRKGISPIRQNDLSHIGGNDFSENRAKDISPLQGTSGTIGSVVRGFKIGVTKWARENSNTYTVWQRNYYEHIIRNQFSYERISEYIYKNPQYWKNDMFYSNE